MPDTQQDLHERVAVLETEAKYAKQATALRAKQIQAVDAKLDTLLLEFSRYRGIVGGILLVVTAVVTFFKLFSESAMAWLK